MSRDPSAARWGGIRHFVAPAKVRLFDLLAGSGARQSAKRDAFIVFGVRAVSAGILYLSQIVLARWMGAAEYGIYVWMWTLVLVLGGLAHLGVGPSLSRLIPAYREHGQLAMLRGLLIGSRGLALVVGVAVALVTCTALHVGGALLNPAYLAPALLGAVCIPLFALTDVQDGLGRAQGWMIAALVPPYILRPLLLLGVMAVAHATGFAMDAMTATVAAIVACGAAAAAQSIMVQHRITAMLPDGPRQYAFGEWVKSSSPLLVLYASELVLQNADVLVLSAYLPPQTIAMYFAAAKTMALVMFVHYAVGSAVAKDFAALHARGDKAALVAYARDAAKWTFWPSLAAAIVILALGKPLLWLFSPRFVEAYPVMLVLVAGFLLRASVGPAEFVLNALGEQKQCARIAATAAGVDILLALLLVPHLGLMGAALGTASALAVASVLYARTARQRTGLDISIWGAMRRA